MSLVPLPHISLLVSLMYLFASFSNIVSGQNDCDINSISKAVHVNQIRAYAAQNGYILSDFNFFDQGYFLPYSGPGSPSGYYAGNIFITGYSESGDLRGSDNHMFSWNEHHYFQPGPLAGEKALDCEEARKWNNIFSVTGQSILQHIDDFTDGKVDFPIDEIFGWPAQGNKHFEKIHGFELKLGPQGGAYFIESPSHQNGIYEPEYGEYPHVEDLPEDQIPGQITWHVYNNAKSQEFYRNFRSKDKMVCEVQECYYAFSCPDTPNNRTLFQQFKITNTGNALIEDFTFSMYMNPDLGCYLDDYIGNSPSKNTMYVYNSDSMNSISPQRCPGSPKHKEIQVAQTLTFLNWPMNASVYCYSSSFSTVPNKNMVTPSMLESYRYFALGKWRNGIPFTKGGNGYDESGFDSTKFAFTDRPANLEGWSMRTEKIANYHAELYSISSIYAEKLFPQESIVLDVAYSFVSDSNSNNWDIVDQALDNVDWIQREYDKRLPRCTPNPPDCQDVWPGDANADGIVNYQDYIPVYMGSGQTGPSRKNPYPFIAQNVKDWNSSTLVGINTKYADADGNGVIDEDDEEMLEDYIGFSNYCYEHNPINCDYGDDVYIELTIPDTLGKGIIRGEVLLKDFEDFVGFSCIIQYDSKVIPFHTWVSVEWLDPAIEVRSYRNFIHSSRNQIGIAAVAKNNKNNPLKNNSDNKLLSLMGNYIPVTEYPKEYVRISICDFILYYEDGSSKKLPTMHKDIYLPDDVIITSSEQMKDPELFAYPNPNNGFFNVRVSQKSLVTIFNQMGQVVLSKSLSSGVNSIDVSHVKPGIFLIRATANDKYIHQKILIQP